MFRYRGLGCLCTLFICTQVSVRSRPWKKTEPYLHSRVSSMTPSAWVKDGVGVESVLFLVALGVCWLKLCVKPDPGSSGRVQDCLQFLPRLRSEPVKNARRCLLAKTDRGRRGCCPEGNVLLSPPLLCGTAPVVFCRISADFLTFFDLEVAHLDEKFIEAQFERTPRLLHYRPYIERVRRRRPHFLPEDVERALDLRRPWSSPAPVVDYYQQAIAESRYRMPWEHEDVNLQIILTKTMSTDPSIRRAALKAVNEYVISVLLPRPPSCSSSLVLVFHRERATAFALCIASLPLFVLFLFVFFPCAGDGCPSPVSFV